MLVAVVVVVVFPVFFLYFYPFFIYFFADFWIAMNVDFRPHPSQQTAAADGMRFRWRGPAAGLAALVLGDTGCGYLVERRWATGCPSAWAQAICGGGISTVGSLGGRIGLKLC